MTQITTASGQIITNDQVLQFAASVGNDVRKIAEKAREVGLADTAEGKSFLAKTFNTDVATVEKHLGGGASGNTSTSSSNTSSGKTTNSNSSSSSSSNSAASSKKTARRQQSGTLVATGGNASTGRSASASKSSGVVPISPLEVPVVRAVVHGQGNANIKDDEINDWIAAAPRTERQMLEKMVELNLSAAQVGKAMGKTEEQINAALLDLGLDKESLDAKEVENFIPIQADEAETVFDTVHGAGNHKISRDDIRTWMNAAPRTAREILDAMVANDVSLTQAGRAFDLTDAQMQGVIKEYGLDPNRLVTTMVSGWTDEDALRFIEKHPDLLDNIGQSHQSVGTLLAGTNNLNDDARVAQDTAADDQAAYEALDAQLQPALKIYNDLAAQISGLEQVIDAEKALIGASQDEIDAYFARFGGTEQLRAMVSYGYDPRAGGKPPSQMSHDELVDFVKTNIGPHGQWGYRYYGGVAADHQIAASTQKINDVQGQIDELRAQMKQMEVWGIPLFQQTQAAKDKWDASAAVAKNKSEIAGAQGQMTQEAADVNTAAVNKALFSGQAMSLWFAANPDLEAIDQVNGLLRDTVTVLDETMTEQRGWLDTARERGWTLEQDARALETQSIAAMDGLDGVQTAAELARIDIEQKQATYDTAVAEENRAWADLDAAVGRTQGEAFNKRLNSETELNIEFYKNALAQATQKRIQAGSDLEAAKAAGQPVMAAGAQAQSAWATVRAKADNARDQSLSELAVGGQIFALESNTTNALASAYGLMITNSATQSALVGALAEAGEIGLDELSALEDTVQGDVQYALSGLNTLQQDVANFRAMADQEQDQLVPLQATAYGTQLIANDKIDDAVYLGSVYDEVVVTDAQLRDLQADVDAAARRLSQAKLGLDVADLRMDWAEKRVNPRKQMRDMDRAAPGLEAAQVELDAAQQDYDAKLALLGSVKYDVGRLHLKPLVLESSWEAESGVIEANIAGTQALAQGGWSRMAEGRYFNLDNVLASVQGLLIQDTSTLSGVQQTMANQLEAIDPVAAELMGVQAQWNGGWANDFAAISDSIRAGQYQTFNDQAQLRELTAVTEGTKLYGDYLGQRVEALGADHGQAKTTLSGMATALTASNALANSTYETADAARTQMNDTELEAMVGYVLTNPRKLDPSFTVESLYPKAREQVIETKLKDEAFASVLPVVRQEMEGGAAQPTDEEFERRVNSVYEELVAQGREVSVTDEEVRRTAMQLFVQEAQDKGITNRQLHKQLRYLDDRQQWVDADPAVQNARAHALGAAQSADAASAQAIDDGLQWQSQAFFTQVQGQRLLGASTQWAGVTSQAADGADQVVAQSDRVIESLKIDQTNQSGMLEYLANYLDGNAQLAQYMGDYGQMAQHPGVQALMSNQKGELENVNLAYAPLAENAEQLIEHAGESLVLAVDQAELWEARATDWRAQATAASTQLGSIQPMIEADGVQLQSDYESFDKELNKAYGFNDSAVAYVREHADKAKDAKELHEDRLTADQVHKKRKKKNLFKMIAMAVIGTVVTIATLGAAAPEVAAFMASAAPALMSAGVTAAGIAIPNTLAFAVAGTVMGAAGSAISQGINVGLKLQDKFSPIGVAAGAISGGIALGSLSNLGSAFQAINGVVGAEAGSLLEKAVGFLSGSMVGAGSELATQGAFNLIGLQKGIEWEDVASMALTIGGMQALNMKMRFEHMRATDSQVPFMKRFADGLTQKYRLASAVVESIAAVPYFLGGRPADGMMALAQGAGGEVLGTGDIFDFAMDPGDAIRPGMHYAQLTGIKDEGVIRAVDNMFRDERGFLRQTAMILDEKLLGNLAEHGVTDKTYLYVGKDGSVKPAELYASAVADDIGQVVYAPSMADRTGMVLPTAQIGVKVGEFAVDGKPATTQTLGLAGTYIDQHGVVKAFDPLRAVRLDEMKEFYGSPWHDMHVKYDLNDVGWLYVKPKALDVEVPLVAVR